MRKPRLLCLLLILSLSLPALAMAGEGWGLLRSQETASPLLDLKKALETPDHTPAPEASGTRHAAQERKNNGYAFTLQLDAAEEWLLDLPLDLYVLKRESDGSYRYVYLEQGLSIDRRGRALYDGTLLCALAQDDATPEYLAPAVLVQSSATENQYRLRALLYPSGSFLDLTFQAVTMTLGIDSSTGDTALLSVEPITEDPAVRRAFDPMHYDVASFTSNTRLPTWDAQGNLLHFYDWDSGDMILGFEACLAEHMRFGTLRAWDWPEGSLYAYLEFYDEETDTSYPFSELIELEGRKL